MQIADRWRRMMISDKALYLEGYPKEDLLMYWQLQVPNKMRAKQMLLDGVFLSAHCIKY